MRSEKERGGKKRKPKLNSSLTSNDFFTQRFRLRQQKKKVFFIYYDAHSKHDVENEKVIDKHLLPER